VVATEVVMKSPVHIVAVLLTTLMLLELSVAKAVHLESTAQSPSRVTVRLSSFEIPFSFFVMLSSNRQLALLILVCGLQLHSVIFHLDQACSKHHPNARLQVLEVLPEPVAVLARDQPIAYARCTMDQ
jgi:hypothetical protein